MVAEQIIEKDKHMVIEYWTDIHTGVEYAVVSDEPQIMATTLTEL